MIINRKIKRTMMENKSQYLGSLILIIISCLLYTMFNQLTSNMTDSSTSFEKNYVQEDASFIADKKLNNIEDLESKFNIIIQETETVDYPVSDGKILRLFSENKKVNIPAITEGEALSSNDILIDPAYAKANKLNIGDSITIFDRNFKLSGYMSLPNYIYPLKSENDILNDAKSFGIAVISKEDFTELKKGSRGYSIKFRDQRNLENNITQFKDYLKNENIMILKWLNVSENPRVVFVTAKINGINSMSSSMPIFILILTCVLTGIVMWRMLKRELISIGTLYALGYRKREIMRHYLSYPLSISLIGGIVGTILGALAVQPMLNLMITYFNIPIMTITFSIKCIVISVLLPVIFLYISGYFVVNKALKYSPVDLIRGGKEKNKVNLIERNLKLDKLKFTTKFKIREMLRSIPRSIFLLLGVILATMLLLMGFVMKSSMDYLMKQTYEETYKYQYQYTFNSIQQGLPSEGEAFSSAPFVLKSDNKTSFFICGINPSSKYIYLKDDSGKLLSKEKVIITKTLASKLKLKNGDTIAVVNKLDSRAYSFTIDSIADSYVGEYIYIPIDKFNSMLGYPADSYMGIWSEHELNISEDKLLGSDTIDDFKNAFDAMTKPMQSYVSVIAFLAFIIGLIVIYVVTSLIIEENKETISLMKVIGYRKKEVYSLILNSSSIIVIVGYILGVPLLLVSIRALLKSATKGMNFAFPIKIEYIYVVAGFAVIYLTYELSKALSKKKINRISMTEALKSQME